MKEENKDFCEYTAAAGTENAADTGKENRQGRDPAKWRRRQFSHVGFAAAGFMILSLILQLILTVVLSAFADVLGIITGRNGQWLSGDVILLISAISMHLIAFPVSALFMHLIPEYGKPQRENWGIGAFLICTVIGMGIGFAGSMMSVLMEMLAPGAAGDGGVTEIMMDSGLWTEMITAVILAPVVEELFFRKLLMDRLLGFGQLTAILISGLMFALAHGNFSQFFYTFGLGVLWAFVYAKTGKIGNTIALHMVFNFLGGVFMAELTRLAEGDMGNLWLLQLMGHFMSAEWVSSIISFFASVIMGFQMLLMFASFIASIVLLVLFGRRIRFAPGEQQMKGAGAFRMVFLNPGMITYASVCALSFVLN